MDWKISKTMISKGFNTIRVVIETQYGILSQMICDISSHYQKELQKIQNEAQHIAKENSDGDYEIYLSILNSFTDIEDVHIELLKECRKIVFCAIFSYYETMLNGFLRYYKISSNARQIGQIFDCILQTYKDRFLDDEIHISNEYILYLNQFCRLLRNFYMHGILSNDNDKYTLFSYVEKVNGIENDLNTIIIREDRFLFNTLDIAKNVLVNIDNSFEGRIQIDNNTLYNGILPL